LNGIEFFFLEEGSMINWSPSSFNNRANVTARNCKQLGEDVLRNRGMRQSYVFQSWRRACGRVQLVLPARVSVLRTFNTSGALNCGSPAP
jgi:hypothetical protein